MRGPARLLVMPHAGADDELAVVDSEDQAVGFVDADTPPSAEVPLEGFGLPDGGVAVSVDALDERVDTLQGFLVAQRPVLKLFPGEIRPQLLHGDDSDACDAARSFWPVAAVRGGGSSACRSGSLRRRRECARDRRAGLRTREPQREGPVGQWSAV